MTNDIYSNGKLVTRSDDTARTVTTYENGTVVNTRAYTEQENLAAEANIKAGAVATNESSLIDKATQAIANNVAYLNRASTTTAQDKAQIKALSRQVNALIKLITKSLDDTTGT